MDTDTDPTGRTWDERFRAAGDGLDLGVYDVRDDVARGHRRVRRTRLAVGGAVVVTAAVVAAGGLALWAGSGSPEGDSSGHFAGSTATPATPLPQQVAASAAARAAAERRQEKLKQMPTDPRTLAFGHHLYDLAADHLDPSRKYLSYDSNTLPTVDSDGTGIGLSVTLGWVLPGQPGEGEVQISVSSMKGSNAEPCGLSSGVTCAPVTMPDGSPALYGEQADGTFAVSYRQPGGDTVDVVVEPLFGGDSTAPAHKMFATRQQIFGLVQDSRIKLPSDRPY